MDFIEGYLFGKVLGRDKYILMPCQPNENNPYGIVKYTYGNAELLRVTKEQADKLDNDDVQWINHDNMVGAIGNYYVGETIGEAILGYEKEIGVTPEIYMRNTSGIAQFERIYDMTENEINEKITLDSFKKLYVYDNDLDEFSHVCDESYNA